MLLLQVSVKIVTLPWVAEVFDICSPFSLSQNKHSTLVTSLVDGVRVETLGHISIHSDWNVFGMVY